MPFLALFIVLLLLLMHACVATRPLYGSTTENLLPNEDVHNSKVLDITSATRDPEAKGESANWHMTKTRELRELKELKELKAIHSIQNSNRKLTLGDKMISFGTREAMQEESDIPDSKRVARLTLESAETTGSDERGEDVVVVVTDYAHPHKKPPIHNAP